MTNSDISEVRDDLINAANAASEPNNPMRWAILAHFAERLLRLAEDHKRLQAACGPKDQTSKKMVELRDWLLQVANAARQPGHAMGWSALSYNAGRILALAEDHQRLQAMCDSVASVPS